ncbi:MAG: ATP-binding protein [bacterium]
MQFQWYILGTIISGLSSAFFGCLVFFYNRNKTGRIFLAFSFSFSLWTLPYAVWLAQPNAVDALFWSRLLNLGAVLIPIFYLQWIVLVLNKEHEHKPLLWFGYIVTIIFAAFSFSPLFIDKVVSVASFPFWPQANILYVIFLCTLLFPFFAYGIFLVGKTYFSNKTDPALKTQSKYILIGSIMSTIAGIANFPLMFSIPFIAPELTLLTIFHPMFWAYGSMRDRVFHVKTIAAEILVFGLWIFIIARIMLFQNTSEQLIEGLLLLVTVVFGIFLIRSVDKEVDQREKIELLAKDLELANERLKELDQQKSEFVSLASHQLRGPLTALKGYASLILEGDFGEISEPVKEAVDKIFKSSTALAVLVGDYLDVSRIEQGRMQYDFSTFDFKELTKTVVEELKPVSDKAGLNVTFDFNVNDTYIIKADQGKIKQVLSNLLDNSIKYTPKGWIKVELSKKNPGSLIELTIQDTGVGIKPEVLPRLFEKFTRAPDASKTNIMGTGLGLYVAKKMIESHNGKIWAESEGAGKGSTFHIELQGV